MTALATGTPVSASATRAAAAGPRTRVRLELTRRGRVVRAVLLLILTAAIAVAVMSASGASSALADWTHGPRTVAVTVQPGDTLWGYAGDYAPRGTDPRDYVLEVQRANHLSGMGLTAGSQIQLPVEP